MPRREEWPPRVHPHRPSGRDRVRWRGRDYYLGSIGSGASRQAYVELIARLSKERQAVENSSGLTIAQVIAHWLVHAKEEYSPEEQENYHYAIAPLAQLYGQTQAESFTPLDLRRVQSHMSKTLARSLVNRRIARIKTLFRWAEMERLVSVGTYHALLALSPLLRPRQGLKEGRKVKPAEGWRVMRAAMWGCYDTLRLHLLLMWYTGARPSEISRMTPQQIERSSDIWFYRPAKHKTAWRGKQRTIYLGPHCVELLRARIDDIDPDGLIVPNWDGGPFNRRTLYVALRRACRRAGVDPFSPYSIRHAVASRLVPAVGLDAARAALGHAGLSMTDHYAQASQNILGCNAARKEG